MIAKGHKIKGIETQMADVAFWQDHAKAAQLSQELSELKSEKEKWDEINLRVSLAEEELKSLVEKVGFKVYYSPKAVAYHDLSTDPNKEAERLLSRGYLVGKNRVLFMKDFGKNFFVFLCFLPVYVFYYAKMGLKHNNFKGIGNFVRGTIEGILSRHV